MRRNWTKIQMDSKTGCLSARFPVWTFCAFLHHPQRFLPCNISRKYSPYITAIFYGSFGFAYHLVLFGAPQFHIHDPKCKQNKSKGGPDNMVCIRKSGYLHHENSVRGHLPKLQAGTVQTCDVIRKITRRYRTFHSGARKLCRRGPFTLNSFWAVDIYRGGSDIVSVIIGLVT